MTGTLSYDVFSDRLLRIGTNIREDNSRRKQAWTPIKPTYGNSTCLKRTGVFEECNAPNV